jgi:two-component sensor histidine kinase
MVTAIQRSTVASLDDELKAAGDGLSGNADVLRSVLAGCGDCIKILDLDGRLQFMSEGGQRVMEVEDFGKLKGCPWPDFWAGQGNADAKAAVATAIAGGTARFQGAANTAIGTPRYWDVQVSPILGDDGKPSHLLSISRDVTTEHEAAAALRDAAERQLLLTQELEHRIKNTLATVSAIANQTMQGDAHAEVRQAFTDRLITLARAHDLLTRTSWSGAPIREVVEGGLAPHRTGRNRIDISGPDLDLQPRQALGLSLAIHELATNAVKYGALVSASGSIDVTWSKGGDADAAFRFIWKESGGPEVKAPPADKLGFGTRLIERMLANDFNGTVKNIYAPTGIVCELVAKSCGL